MPVHVHALIDGLGVGGAETLLADFAAGAAGGGLRLTVGHLYDRPAEPAARRLRDLGIEPVRVAARGLADPRSLAAVRAHLRAVAPDVVHTHLAYADLLGGLAARSLRLPCVSTLHVMAWPGDPRARVLDGAAAAVRRRCAGRVIAVSEPARAAYLARWDDPERVVVVNNGVRGDARPGAGAAVRAELGLAPGDLVVTMLAVLRDGKGHDVAVDAVRALRERHPSLRLVIAGDGPQRAQIAALAAPLGDAVRLVGHRDDVMALLDASDVLLHPARVDAFPTALLEALAAGVPIVATPVGGIPEITGEVLAPPAAIAAALDALLRDPARRAALAAAGRARFAERFTVDRWVARTRAVYEAAMRRMP